MAKSSKQKQQDILKELDKFLRRYSFLDEFEYYLDINELEMNRTMKTFGKKLNRIMVGVFAGDLTITLSKEAYRDIINSMRAFNKRFSVKGSPTRLGKSTRIRLMRALVRQYSTHMTQMSNSTTAKNLNKGREFRLISQNAQVPAAALAETTNREILIKSGKKYYKKQLNDAWSLLTEKYGLYDTVIFSDSRTATGTKQYPLRAYTDNRMTTNRQEVARATATAYSAKTGTLTMKISRHNTQDSCIYWEGKIVFTNEAAKKIYVKRFRQGQEWPTLQQVVADRTHTFRFGCKHFTNPWPIQSMPKKQRDNQADKNEMFEVPKKINETKIKKKIQSNDLELEAA